MQIIDFILHVDKYIDTFITMYGQLVYFLIFIVIFCETGLVFLPFLPGDSLIFAVGAFAATGKLNVWILYVILTLAAILGDTVNYEIGKHFGRRIIEYKKIRLIKEDHIKQADAFIEKHGGQAVFLARFTPIIRTIVPFIVGMGKYKYEKFIKANALGGILWVALFLGLGYFFGNISLVKEHFSLILIAIILISLIPVVVSYFKWKRSNKK